MNKKIDDIIEDIWCNDLVRVQWKVYELTKKYDKNTTLDNYQDKSIEILDRLSWIDKIKMKWYAKRTELLLYSMTNK